MYKTNLDWGKIRHFPISKQKVKFVKKRCCRCFLFDYFSTSGLKNMFNINRHAEVSYIQFIRQRMSQESYRKSVRSKDETWSGNRQWIWTNSKCLSSTLLMVPFTIYFNQLCPNVSDQSTHNTNSACEVWLVLRLTWLKHGWKKCNLRFKHHSWYKDTTGVNTTTIPRMRGE